MVFVGQKVGEGMDRQSLALAGDQDALIDAVAAANPRTVVILNTGGAVTMPWLDKVAGVMEMWLPGDVQGPAAARLLFGDAEPSGRLPVTFPRDETQGPATKPPQYPGDLSANGAVDTVHFDEGVMIGYRYWDQFKQQPLFPFGFGLSYTQFKSQDFSVRRTADGGAEVRGTISNTGGRDGAEVVEVYIGFPKAAGEPPRQLKGFAKADVRVGQSVRVTVKLDSDAFKAWDEKTKAWTTYHGGYDVFVGTSSRDIDYTGHLAL